MDDIVVIGYSLLFEDYWSFFERPNYFKDMKKIENNMEAQVTPWFTENNIYVYILCT